MQRSAGHDERMIAGVFGAEVDAFLAVGGTGGELATHGEPPTPRRPGRGHGDCALVGVGQREEGVRGCLEPLLQGGRDAVADDREEADGPAGGVDLPGDRCESGLGCALIEEWGDIDHGQRGGGVWGSAHDLVTYRSATGA